MPDAAPAKGAPAARNAEQKPEENKLWSTAKMVIMYWMVAQVLTRFVITPLFQTYGPSTPAPPADESKGTGPYPEQVKNTPAANADLIAKPYWPRGTPLSLDIYIAASENLGDVLNVNPKPNMELAHMSWGGFKWGDWNIDHSWTGDITLPQSVRSNKTSVWAHMFLSADGANHKPFESGFIWDKVHYTKKQLTSYKPRRKLRRELNLLTATPEEVAQAEAEELEVKNSPWVPYWYQNVTLALVSDSGELPVNKLPPPLAAHVVLAKPERRPGPDAKAQYYPVLYPNTFWELSSHWQPYGSQNTTLPLRIDFHSTSWMKFQIYASLAVGFDQAAQQNPGASGEFDEVKRMFLETSPWLLITTAIVSLLHVVFEFLAFAADVGHWRKKKEFTGVSVRTIVTNVFIQVVILLYLLDNNEETSWMILFGQGSGALIEAWKITKVLNFELVPSAPGSILPYRVLVTDKHVLTEDEKKTQEYDQLAYRYVSYVAVPLLAGYTIYSLIYNTHKGWYSFTIQTLTSFVYTFGFAQLVPQLIINYKLKSVAHLPAKAFVYKFLGTIVDDFFAFCIKMPFLHRLACFRDDVVFLVFLYQRWIYRVDPKRINEYGQVSTEDADAIKDADAPKGESKKDK